MYQKTDIRENETKNMLYPEKDRYVCSKIFLGKPHQVGLCDRSAIEEKEKK